MAATQLYDHVDAQRDRLYELAAEIWETPELALHEEESAATLVAALRAEGFDVEEGVGGMPTAFVASYGEGDPKIGVLGEFDALPGLSQQVVAEKSPLEAGAPGHGCGHNLFGVACLGGAVAVKRAIEAGRLDGTVVYYGCPAEETLVGKVFMARAGVFDDLDAAVTWHPSDLNTPQREGSLALDSVEFTFEGTAAHAAAAPESGRSALDAVQLLNTGVEYVREHVSEKARIHYAITDGGDAPNVVPAEATVWYFVRAPTRAEVERISDWLSDVAEGAALMTQTSVERNYVTGCYDYLPNDAIVDAMWEVMTEVETQGFDDDDRAFAADLQATLPETDVQNRIDQLPEEFRAEVAESALYERPVPAFPTGSHGSTDVGDVSYITPTAQFRAATWAVGTPAHSWQAVAANNSFGEKGMVYAAKVVAGTVAELLADADLRAAATAEFESKTAGRAYETPLPADAEPPFDMNA